MDTQGLKVQVYEALDNAMENGYTMVGRDAARVAADLAQYDSRLELVAPSILTIYVQEWQKDRKISENP